MDSGEIQIKPNDVFSHLRYEIKTLKSISGMFSIAIGTESTLKSSGSPSQDDSLSFSMTRRHTALKALRGG